MIEKIETVQVEKLALPEVATDDLLYDRMLDMLRHDIPGFVLRRAVEITSIEQATQVHEENIARVQAALKRMHPDKRIKPRHLPGPIELGNESIGWFHNDMWEGVSSPGISHTEPLIHTTISGAGNVHLAKPGTMPEKIIEAQEDLGARYIFKESSDPYHPHNLLKNHLVNPELTDPTLYSTYLRTGDSIVMADNGRHSAWHRFDTDTDHTSERTAIATALKDKTRKVIKRKAMRGFDLR